MAVEVENVRATQSNQHTGSGFELQAKVIGNIKTRHRECTCASGGQPLSQGTSPKRTMVTKASITGRIGMVPTAPGVARHGKPPPHIASDDNVTEAHPGAISCRESEQAAREARPPVRRSERAACGDSAKEPVGIRY